MYSRIANSRNAKHVPILLKTAVFEHYFRFLTVKRVFLLQLSHA